MPYFDEFHQKNKDEDFVVIAISPMENRDIVKKYIEEEGYSFPVLLDTTAAAAYVYRIMYTPTTYLIDGEGKILEIIIGPLDFEGIKEKF